MNISINQRPLKTADDHIPIEGETLYFINHRINDCKIYKFVCGNWHTGGEVNVHNDPSLPPKKISLAGYPKGFYPPEETNIYSVLYYKDVYFKFENAVADYQKRIKKMQKLKLKEEDCKEIKRTYDR